MQFVDPKTKAPLTLEESGEAYISEAGARYPIDKGVPIFSKEFYTDNFGEQWNDFPLTQIDSSNADQISAERMEQTFGFDLSELAGKTLLEVGSGAGRFTEIFLKHGAKVYTCDASNAIVANYQNNASSGDGTFFQASIYDLPIPRNSFDFVVCVGVIQHLPDAKRGIACLAECVKPGGQLVIDHYRWEMARRLAPRYLIGRRITSRLSTEMNRKIAKAYVSMWWPMRSLFASESARKIATTLSPLAPITYYKNFYNNAPEDKLRELAVLDTNDFISARYDIGLTRNQLSKIIESTGATSHEVFTNHELAEQYGSLRTAGLVARATYG